MNFETTNNATTTSDVSTINTKGDKMENTTADNTTTNENVFYSKRTGLTHADARNFGRDRIEAVVKAFKSNVLPADERAIAKLETDARTITYKQLQEVYTIGWAIRETESAGDEFKIVLSDNGLGGLVKKLTAKTFWKALVTLLYGEVKEIETENGKKTVCEPNRSAEKYANCLRLMAETGVPKEKVAQYIANFKDPEFGGGLAGMEARDRKRNPGPAKMEPTIPTDLSIGQKHKRDQLIKRGENMDLNDDVFPATKAPESLQYGQAVFKLVNGEMVIVGYEKWAQAKYENYVINRARKAVKEEEELQAQEDARRAALEADALEAIAANEQREQAAALIQAGIPKDAVQQAIAKALAAISVPADISQFADVDVG